MNGQSPFTIVALAMIRFYKRRISPLLPNACRYTPTCSAYAAEAIEAFGLLYGGRLALRRVLRCNPLHKGGYDPVPRPDRWREGETPSTLIHGGNTGP